MTMKKEQSQSATAENRIPIYVKRSHLKRVIALAKAHDNLNMRQIFDASLTIGLRKLEGGVE